MKVLLNDSLYIDFTDYSINVELDSVASTFAFACKFDTTDLKTRDFFKPLSYQEIKIFDDEDKLSVTGIITNWQFNSESAPNLVVLSGYSKAGVLEDCSISRSSYPLESINRNLNEIVSKVLKPFNISFIVNPSATAISNRIFAKSIAEPSETVKSYLSKITAQRNIVLSHNEKGDLVFSKINLNALPVKKYTKDNTSNMSLLVDGQTLHSELTIIRQATKTVSKTVDDKVKKKKVKTESFSTIRNANIKVYRPTVQVLTSGTENDTTDAVENFAATEMKEALKLTIVLNNFEKEVNTGSIVMVQNDDLFLFKDTKFIVQTKNVTRNSDKEVTTFSLVLLSAYGGNLANNIF